MNGLEVREHATEPTLIDIRHTYAGRLLCDWLLSLLLGTDEHHRTAMSNGFLDELVGTIDVRQRLLKIDDVDAVALVEDESLHLRVPTAGLMPEVHAAFQQLLHCYDGHGLVAP